MTTYAVITPTIGSDSLKRCIESLLDQDCNHYLFVDGTEYEDSVNDICHDVGFSQFDRLVVTVIPKNIGKVGGNFYGHRVFGASPFLVNEDVLCFMDEDNWVEPNYIKAFNDVFDEHKYHWAYTLRNIASATGEIICQDNCESLGHWPVMSNEGRYHIDTGCFAVPRQLVTKLSPHWYGEWGQDRVFFNALKASSPNFGCTNAYTLNYRLGSETSRASKEMFLSGNKSAAEFYKEVYPWRTQRAHERTPAVLLYQTT